ncbi:hypothetical protein NM208_g13423 [Fusarium decemcellulare]|uniref:Uncharacterized protein n=1 Tax=Fusarium decemcellulare TaxID=57161 RepID=A0ACC1RLT0_9HYPO|nr:hypothetical protein NM208_g13423 [Fusarium decemcellulare]
MATVTQTETSSAPVAYELQSQPQTSDRNSLNDPGPPDESNKPSRAELLKIMSAGFSFFVAGVNDGSIGALVPHVIRDYGVTTAIVSSVYGANFMGWFVGAFSNTHLCEICDLGSMLALGACLQVLAHALRSWKPPFALFTVTFWLASLGQAYQDTHGNTYVAGTKGSHRWLAFIHAMYMAGCLVGPFVATGVASAGSVSRWYLFYTFPLGIGVINVALVMVAFWDTLRIKRKQPVTERTLEADQAPVSRNEDALLLMKETLKNKSVWLISLFFFFFLGATLTASGWVVEYLVVVRDGDLNSMGYVPAGFSGGSLLGRLLLAEPVHRFGIRRMIFGFTIISIGLQVLFWQVPNIIAASIAISLLGFFMGPYFATGISVASKLFSPHLRSTALAFVFVFAQLGGCLFPIITGLVAASAGVSVLQPVLCGLLTATAIAWLFVPMPKEGDNPTLHQDTACRGMVPLLINDLANGGSSSCDKNMPSCTSCMKAGIECVRALQVRFRSGLDSTDEFAFSDSQVWVQPERNLEYCDETAQLSQIYDTEDKEEIETRAPDHMQFSFDSAPVEPIVESTRSPGFHTSPNMMVSPETNGSDFSESRGSVRMTRHLRDSSSLDMSPRSPSSHPVVPFTTREAILIRNFTENMALWADATDLRRHFEIEVPRRSLYFPVLRYAVFAFSSRHLNRNMSDTTTEALEYYDKCLSLLIEAVAEQNGPVDEETLAAIAILRQYEEMDADDKELHLNGTSRIVNSMSVFDFNGGLGEAAAWLCLRQDIYISLTKQRPLRSDLDTYLQSDVFKRVDDAAYANRMVFLLAKALGCAFSSATPCSVDREEIRQEVDNWFDAKPPAFNPIYEVKRDRAEGRLLPEIWVLSPFHAVGLQYYHIAKIILAMSTPIVASSVFENIRQGKRVEQTARNHLLQVIALASSHSRAENALFTARHSLSVWGGVFAEKEDQEMVLNFLDHVQQRTGWNTSPLRASLQEQWIQDTRE